jgi:ABC-type transport system involved in cytochrome c biogenesis permease subunit
VIEPNPSLVLLAQWLLGGAFTAYLAATLLFISGFIGNRISRGARFARNGRWGVQAHLLGVLFHAGAIIARWQGSGHWPTSNMYEFIGFMTFTSMVAFQIICRMYELPLLGSVVAPVGVLTMAYSYVFPPAVAPLVPALKSYWLPIHVSMAALGEGFFAVAFGAALLYLLRVRGLELAAAEALRAHVAATASPDVPVPEGGSLPSHAEARSDWERVWGHRGLETLFYVVLVIIGFTLFALTMRYSGYQWIFDTVTYRLPPLIGPAGAIAGSKGNLLGFIPMPIVMAPVGWSGRQFNTLIYSVVLGGVLYGLVRRFVTHGPIGDALARRVSGDPEMLDEISYRAVAIGYPVFTLGALIFAMLWAKSAWGRYWFWDPKETWAFISWLVYTAYLHLRMSRGWEGRKAAWVAVLGFGVVLFTLVGVNLLIVGLHSYAGGDK